MWSKTKSYFEESRRERQIGMVLPLMKLGTLAFRFVSKPFANKLKKQAGRHPKFRELIIGLAQANHRLTTTIQRQIYGRATDVAIRPLNEERAVQAASELLGEAFLFAVAGAAIVFEVHRNAKKEELAKQKLEEDRKRIETLVKEAELDKQRHELLAQEFELLKLKVAEMEKLANSRGLFGAFHFTMPKSQTEGTNAANAA